MLCLCTMGTRGFFLACGEELRFVACRPTRVRPKAEGRRHERRSREKKRLAHSALIYRASWTLTLSLICQLKPRSQDCLIN